MTGSFTNCKSNVENFPVGGLRGVGDLLGCQLGCKRWFIERKSQT